MTSGNTSSDKSSGKRKDRETLEMLAAFCAYRERSSAEVMEKMRVLGLGDQESRRLLKILSDEGLQSDTRFAEAYVSGKLRIKRWGRHKIRYGLMAAGIAKPMAELVLSDIDEALYRRNLEKVLEIKTSAYRKYNGMELRRRLYRSALQMGYESELILKALEKRNV